MGYTTDFTGHVTVDPPLNADEIAYLTKFAETRRMHRHNGPYFVDGSGPWGQGRDPDVIDHNQQPPGQPNLWCQWVPSKDGSRIEWDGGEKFYDSAEWMIYLINVFLKPGAVVQRDMTALAVPGDDGAPLPDAFSRFTFDHVVNGRIEAQGERSDDRWALIVTDNVVTVEKYPPLAERLQSDPDLAAAFELVKAAGVTVEQYAQLTGQDW